MAACDSNTNAGGSVPVAGHGNRAQDCHQGDHLFEPVHQDPDRLSELILEWGLLVDACDFELDGSRIHPRFDRLMDQRALVGKDTEDGPLGDTGRLGYLAGGDVGTLLDEERDDRLDDCSPAVVRRHWGCTAVFHRPPQ